MGQETAPSSRQDLTKISIPPHMSFCECFPKQSSLYIRRIKDRLWCSLYILRTKDIPHLPMWWNLLGFSTGYQTNLSHSSLSSCFPIMIRQCHWVFTLMQEKSTACTLRSSERYSHNTERTRSAISMHQMLSSQPLKMQ